MSFVHGILYHWSTIILFRSFVHGIQYHWSKIIIIFMFQLFVLSCYVSLRSEFRVVMSVTDFPITTMFGSSFPPVIFRRAHGCLIYVICVCLRIVVSTKYCVVFLLYFSSSCLPYVASFSGLSNFDYPFDILQRLLHTCEF